MNSITELEKQVRELELKAGGGKALDAARTEALTRRIVGTEYTTAEERYAAQALVIRLSRLGRVIQAAPRRGAKEPRAADNTPRRRHARY
jgi:hypothetical protein